MPTYIVNLSSTDRTQSHLVGGKAANLGELYKINDIQIPEGFCITTAAFAKTVSANEQLKSQLTQLSAIHAADRKAISEFSKEIRYTIESIPIQDDIIEEIRTHLKNFSPHTPVAVRSSATAEDLPDASFAGQQDSYLNVIGETEIMRHVTKCWASLFTDRAVAYRIKNGFDHRKIQLAVIIQKMIDAEAAGVMFTADPVTGDRKTITLEAGIGLGESLVSGLINPDRYKVRNGSIVDRSLPAIQPALRDDQITNLAQAGRKIEQHFNTPQDIEWCISGSKCYILQSRPITTLFPIPQTDDQENRIYVSVGHQQMMTDAIKPLGMSIRQMTMVRPMAVAGGRQFVDATPMLLSPTSRKTILETFGNGDPLIRNAIETVLQRGDFLRLLPDDSAQSPGKVLSTTGARHQIQNDPAIVNDLIRQSQQAIQDLRYNIEDKRGIALFDFIEKDFKGLKSLLFDTQVMAAILAPMDAALWLNEKMKEWLGDINVADTLSLSVPNNITSEMGLELLDIADLIRPYPVLTEYLRQEKGDDFPDHLSTLPGGTQAREAIKKFLDKYGMRCPGEIDITRPRWSENPAALIPSILINIRDHQPGESQRKLEKGRKEAFDIEQDVLTRLKQLPDGDHRADETKAMISMVRNFSGYREYPKYHIVSRYFIYKQALIKEAADLKAKSLIRQIDDIFYLSFDELKELVQTQKSDHGLIDKRRAEHRHNEKLMPPRVMTSDGEIINGTYNKTNLPPGAIPGLAVSSGIVEGRARVITNMEEADLEAGDILVTRFTDPSWTPLFISIKGLVTEVGGLMTHGAVIAREYGLPAVVGIDNAAKLIKDGQMIRLNGTEGYIQVL